MVLVHGKAKAERHWVDQSALLENNFLLTRFPSASASLSKVTMNGNLSRRTNFSLIKCLLIGPFCSLRPPIRSSSHRNSGCRKTPSRQPTGRRRPVPVPRGNCPRLRLHRDRWISTSRYVKALRMGLAFFQNFTTNLGSQRWSIDQIWNNAHRHSGLSE